jgi:hypothetical protein
MVPIQKLIDDRTGRSTTLGMFYPRHRAVYFTPGFFGVAQFLRGLGMSLFTHYARLDACRIRTD